MTPIKLLVLCGGRSAEHAISLVSTWNLLSTINKDSFEASLIAIDKGGNWWLQDIDDFLAQEPNPRTIGIPDQSINVLLNVGNTEKKFLLKGSGDVLPKVDVVFPLLHGPNGEDGSIQGLLEHLQLPYIGPGVLGSSVCMDKDVAKRLMLQAGVPTSDFITLIKEGAQLPFKDVVAKLGLPIFVKPANLGSSVGINKVRNAEEYEAALKEAFKYDVKVIIEEFVEGKEVECAILGNTDCIVSEPGTYVHSDDFFDYDTKYLKSEGIQMQIPASDLSELQIAEVKELSLKAYKALACEGLARVDTFFTPEGKFLVNEINTLPGFTQNSMYPILIEKTGVKYNDLVIQLSKLAIKRFER